MQTHFTADQLDQPPIAEANGILRACVHCGFCLSSCPTYALTGDELDSPRGRIYLIKNMLERGGAPDADTVHHIDRCLSCMSCLTACPSGVDYLHLVDTARAHIETHHRRSLADRLLRWLMATVLPRPRVFRAALTMAQPARMFRGLMPKRLRRLTEFAPKKIPRSVSLVGVHRPDGQPVKRIAMLAGCVQSVLGGGINEATIRLLTRHGCEVIVAADAGCCGALVQHMGNQSSARSQARANILAWSSIEGSVDAVVVTASGCGTTVKDYGHMFADDPDMAQTAASIAAIAKDVTEIMAELGLGAAVHRSDVTVAYHDACSLQHGQGIRAEPRALLEQAGFKVSDIAEGQFCCGSAGTYNLLQPEMADALGVRKAGHVDATGAKVVASGNLGCMIQMARFTDRPMVHTVELLDWATGGPKPPALDIPRAGVS
jgi:glycolate oxidase iron-sulfur subunit